MPKKLVGGEGGDKLPNQRNHLRRRLLASERPTQRKTKTAGKTSTRGGELGFIYNRVRDITNFSRKGSKIEEISDESLVPTSHPTLAAAAARGSVGFVCVRYGFVSPDEWRRFRWRRPSVGGHRQGLGPGRPCHGEDEHHQEVRTARGRRGVCWEGRGTAAEGAGGGGCLLGGKEGGGGEVYSFLPFLPDSLGVFTTTNDHASTESPFCGGGSILVAIVRPNESGVSMSHFRLETGSGL